MKKCSLFILFLCLGCTEEISFETENISVLVVDGFITNQFGPHTISLRKTARFTDALSGGSEQPVTGAWVSIHDDLRHPIELVETADGIYTTPGTFQAEVGRAYSLFITTPEGKRYQSDAEVVQPSGSIDSMYYTVTQEDVFSSAGEIIPERRVNFYTNFSFPDTDSFYKWDWDGTYVYKTTFPESGSVPERCYVSEYPKEGHINLLSSNSFSTREIENHLVLSKKVDFNWKVRYSMHIKEYSMTEAAYVFWKAVERQVDRNGSIFDPAPAKIAGNVKSLDDPDENVLGYFAAYGMQDSRLFIPGLDIPDSVNSCLLPLFFSDEKPPEFCEDCSVLHLSEVEPPDFWED